MGLSASWYQLSLVGMYKLQRSYPGNVRPTEAPNTAMNPRTSLARGANHCHRLSYPRNQVKLENRNGLGATFYEAIALRSWVPGIGRALLDRGEGIPGDTLPFNETWMPKESPARANVTLSIKRIQKSYFHILSHLNWLHQPQDL